MSVYRARIPGAITYPRKFATMAEARELLSALGQCGYVNEYNAAGKLVAQHHHPIA